MKNYMKQKTPVSRFRGRRRQESSAIKQTKTENRRRNVNVTVMIDNSYDRSKIISERLHSTGANITKLLAI